MSGPSHFDQLRDAVQKEISDEALRANRCDRFLEQVIRYQSGHGSLPDEQEFLLWREDLKKAVAVRALRGGADLGAQDAAEPDAAASAPRQTLPRRRRQGRGRTDSPVP